jgi:phosphatidylglycerol:prolipoprotein diacylglycerol transferase
VHPIAFELGSLTIHWYGVMVALAFLAGLWTATRRGLRDGLRPEAIADLGPWLIVAGVVGARVLYVISYWDESFAGRPFWEVFMIWRGGLVFYGGLIAAVLAAVVYVKWKQLPPMKVGDVMAPSIALGHVFGRLGCFLNGCCFGSTCTLPWAVRFPGDHETGGRGVHPVQLYEAGLNLVLYVALEWLYRRKRFDGQVFGLYLVAYALLRVAVEFVRGDYGSHRIGPVTPGQGVSAVILVSGLAILWIQGRAARRKARA